MDEPAPLSTRSSTLQDRGPDRTNCASSYTIVIVTHNMQQASRISQLTAFFTMGEDRAGYLVEVRHDGQHLHQSTSSS